MSTSRNPDRGLIPRVTRICLFVALLAYVSSGGQASHSGTLTNKYSVAEPEVVDIFFVDAMHGWIAAQDTDQCYLFSTADGGGTWIPRVTPPCLYKIWFASAQSGWALSMEWNGKGDEPIITRLWRSTDGGSSWSIVSVVLVSSYEENKMISDFVFVDELHGVFVGHQALGTGLILRTGDGGKSVSEVPYVQGTVGILSDVASDSVGNVLVVGKDTILRSTDKECTWEQELGSGKRPGWPASILLSAAWVTAERQGWAIGEEVVLRTEELGEPWTIVRRFSETTHVADLYFWDSINGCAVGHSTTIFCTSDGGKTWSTREQLPQARDEQSQLFRRIVLLPSGRGWVIRTGGYLYQTDDGGSSWHELDLAQSFKANTPNR